MHIKMLLIIAVINLLSSCDWLKVTRINGTYICVDRYGFTSLSFGNNYVDVKKWGENMSGEYEIDGEKIFIKNVLGTHALDIINNNILKGSSGGFYGTFVKEEYIFEYLDMFRSSLLGYYSVSTSKLNLREGPGASYASIGTLKKGDIVEVIEIADDLKIGEIEFPDIMNPKWFKIKTKNKEGYVSSKHIQKVEGKQIRHPI